MRPSLWAPASMLMIWGAYCFGTPMAMVITLAALTVLLTVVIEHADDPLTGVMATTIEGFSLEELQADVQELGGNADLPLYLAGVGVGIIPATDWFTAQVDGRTVLILEHIDHTPAQESTRMRDISPRMEA